MTPLDNLVIGNGAGSVKDMHGVVAMCKSAATRITFGSVTILERTGNIGDTYYCHPFERWSLNSLGLPNKGMAGYRLTLPDMAQKAHEHGKEFWVSVAGFTPEEYAELTLEALQAGADGVELNLSCPNVWGKSGRKAIPAFDREMLHRTYDAVGTVLLTENSGAQIGAKASPTDDHKMMEMFAYTTASSGLVCEVVGFNTEGGQRRTRDDGKDALSFRFSKDDTEAKHEGGLAGMALSEKTPNRVKNLVELLPPSIPVRALGGIFDGQNALDNLIAGAQGVMCTTAYIEQGPGVFSHILQGLSELVPETA